MLICFMLAHLRIPIFSSTRLLILLTVSTSYLTDLCRSLRHMISKTNYIKKERKTDVVEELKTEPNLWTLHNGVQWTCFLLQCTLLSLMHTSSKSSSSLLIMRLVMLSRIVCSSDWHPSSSSSSSSLSSSLGLAVRRMFCSHSRQCTVQLTRWAWNGTNTIYSKTLTQQKKKYSHKKAPMQWVVPVAPGGRLGLRVLWCTVPVSPGAGGLVQARSTASAKDTKTWDSMALHVIDHMTNRLLYVTQYTRNTHTYLREQSLHDGACKLRVATEDIVETLK